MYSHLLYSFIIFASSTCLARHRIKNSTQQLFAAMRLPAQNSGFKVISSKPCTNYLKPIDCQCHWHRGTFSISNVSFHHFKIRNAESSDCSRLNTSNNNWQSTRCILFTLKSNGEISEASTKIHQKPLCAREERHVSTSPGLHLQIHHSKQHLGTIFGTLLKITSQWSKAKLEMRKADWRSWKRMKKEPITAISVSPLVHIRMRTDHFCITQNIRVIHCIHRFLPSCSPGFSSVLVDLAQEMSLNEHISSWICENVCKLDSSHSWKVCKKRQKYA